MAPKGKAKNIAIKLLSTWFIAKFKLFDNIVDCVSDVLVISQSRSAMILFSRDFKLQLLELIIY